MNRTSRVPTLMSPPVCYLCKHSDNESNKLVVKTLLIRDAVLREKWIDLWVSYVQRITFNDMYSIQI